MTPGTRRAVAAIAASMSSTQSVSHVYDYSEARHVPLGGRVSNGKLSLYDYEAGCHVAGTRGSYFHYGNGAHITLTARGNSFSGYDYASGDHFSGTLSGRSVSLYDYGAGSYFNYSV